VKKGEWYEMRLGIWEGASSHSLLGIVRNLDFILKSNGKPVEV